MKVREIYEYMDKFAPFNTAEAFDNCGLIIGDMESEITKIGLALDITHEIIDKAIKEGVNLIVTHHPVIFRPLLSKINAPSPVFKLIENKISTIAAHTNLDKCEGGVNTVLANIYELDDVTSPVELLDLGRVGILNKDITVCEYAKIIKENLKATGVRYYDSGKPPKNVAYISGGGTGMFDDVVKLGVDTFITGDIKHDIFIEAQNLGLNLIEAGHFDSENIVFASLSENLKKIYKELDIIILSTENKVKTI